MVVSLPEAPVLCCALASRWESLEAQLLKRGVGDHRGAHSDSKALSEPFDEKSLFSILKPRRNFEGLFFF